VLQEVTTAPSAEQQDDDTFVSAGAEEHDYLVRG
jgi:hypothetical protein